MNRIEQSTRSPKQPTIASSQFEITSASFSRVASDAPHAIFAPLHYERNYDYPLIVWLHGPGSDERQLRHVMPAVSMRNYVAVAPRGLAAKDEPGSPWPQSPEAIHRAEQRIFDSIDATAGKFRFSSERVFLAGFGDGGTMAFRVAMNHPERFAGVLSLCGAFPTGQTPFGRLPEARRLPVFMAVGRDSRRYPPEDACADLRLLHAAGLSITLRQYPSADQISPQMLGDVDRWIIEMITAPREQ
ncbi:MAG: alpha/beta hydrolase-fold protein [Planctomycetia bacterium]|nr:alpha/beta hydrolase-fold protein [Planctomycetia bacterium]